METLSILRHFFTHRALCALPVAGLMIGSTGCEWVSDSDGDGWSILNGDCDDTEASIYPGAAEVCDGFDNDCDSLTDEGMDSDDDGVVDCQDEEVCDGVDNDGDDLIDEGFDQDKDGLADCFDSESCDGLDNDGDGEVDEAPLCAVSHSDPGDEEGSDDEEGSEGEEGEEDAAPCLSIWQAHALKVVKMVSIEDGSIVKVTNNGSADLCLDEQVLYTSAQTQTLVWDIGVVSSPTRLHPGESVTIGSVQNQASMESWIPHPDPLLWWCLEFNQYVSYGASFDYFGEEPPGEVLHLMNDKTDLDRDGIEDHVDFNAQGTQAQSNVWAYLFDHGSLTVGKTATVAGSQVTVRLTIRNVGFHDSSGTVSDTIPAGWRLISSSVQATSLGLQTDGSTALTFDASVPASVGTTVYQQTISYVLVKSDDVELSYQEFEPANIYYFDQEDWDMNYSLPAAVYWNTPQ